MLPSLPVVGDEGILIDNADERLRQAPVVSLFGETLILAIGGNINASPPDPTRVIAVELNVGDRAASRREIELSPSYLGGLVALESGVVAVGLLDAASEGAERASGVVVSKPGAARWSKGVSIERAGRVDIVQIGPNSITKIASLSASAPASWAGFGSALDMTGELLVVGEPGAEPAKVHLYRRDRTGRFAAAPFNSIVGNPRFGSALAIVDRLLIIGASDRHCCDAAVTVFDISGFVPRELEKRVNPDTSTPIAYGSTIESFGTGAVIGGVGISLGDGAPFSGGLDVYNTTAGALGTRSRLDPGPIEQQDGFGRHDRVVTANDAVAVQHRGEILVFRGDSNGWPISARVVLSDKPRIVQFGFDGRRLVLVSEVRDGQRLLGWRIHVHPVL